MSHKKFARTLLVSALFAGVAAPSYASVTRSGPTSAAISAATRGTAVAYDSINKVYLVVGSNGVLRGRFVGADGAPVGAPFTIQGNTANFAHFPRVAFSPDADGGAGGFLVTWHEGGPNVHGRMVSYRQGGAFGPDNLLSGDVSWWEAGAAVAYATGSKEFVVVYRRLAGNEISGVRVNNAATPLAVFNLTSTAAQYEDNPSIAYNPARDEFLVVYAGFNDAGNYAFVDAQRVAAGVTPPSATGVRLVQTGGTYITDVTYNSSTGQYLAAWYSLPSGAALGRVVNPDGSLASDVITLSTRWKAYDALSVAYNAASNTSFMVSHSSGPEDGGVELALSGAPMDNGFVVTDTAALGGKGNYYPRLAASTDTGAWLISTATNFAMTSVQLVGNGGGSAPPPPVGGGTPAPVPTPLMNTDAPSNGQIVAGSVFVAGWSIDKGTTNGSTGVDIIQVWAYPTSGAAPIFVGTPTYGLSRPDVGAAFGAQFTNSGFALTASLPGGSYDLLVYAHSVVTNSYSNVQMRRITVTGPISVPRMWSDLPTQHQTLTQNNVVVGGWAVDTGSSTGTGVDAVHVYAYPSTGAAPILVGVAVYGIARPDVAGALGSARFTPSGFAVQGSLPPGDYNLVVFAHSTVADAFNNVQVIAIQVR